MVGDPPDAETTRLRQRAHAIAWDDCASETNGYLTWEGNHSCGGYGCCGGGKDIDRQALEWVIYEALVEAAQPSPVVPSQELERQIKSVMHHAHLDRVGAIEFLRALHGVDPSPVVPQQTPSTRYTTRPFPDTPLEETPFFPDDPVVPQQTETKEDPRQSSPYPDRPTGSPRENRNETASSDVCDHGTAMDVHCCACRRSGFFPPDNCDCYGGV